jgi:hypothetical protein
VSRTGVCGRWCIAGIRSCYVWEGGEDVFRVLELEAETVSGKQEAIRLMVV